MPMYLLANYFAFKSVASIIYLPHSKTRDICGKSAGFPFPYDSNSNGNSNNPQMRSNFHVI